MRTANKLIILLAAVLVVTGCDWLRSQLGMATSQELEELKTERIREEAEQRVKDSLEKVIADSLAMVADSLEAQEAGKNASLDETKRFHVILGSFKVHSNSERMAENLKKKGYEPVVFSFYNGFEAVSVCSYDHVTPAFNAMYRLLDEGFGPDDIWVYDIRQNLHK
jgi:hypothetical protein